ncbi:hypothetical protein IH779_02170 [Patescibacteria group bacterium]|nr:hypothetical protein [Patescibacteria group bacterium]
MRDIVHRFWVWYERNLVLNTSIAAGLFLWQLVHLFWLFTNVVLLRLFGESYFNLSGTWEYVIIFVDYTEIPAILSVSLLYINDLRKGFRWKPVWFLLLLNSQWLHLFWLTDEFVVSQLIGSVRNPFLPLWLAWIAIGVDYLELPVMYDITKKAIDGIKKKLSKQKSAQGKS